MELTEPVLRALVERYARLVARVGGEIGERPLVLPTGEHFPDRFTGDEKSVRRLAKRMQAHAGLSDIPISVHVIGEDDASCGTGGCGTGSCATQSSQDPGEIERLVEEGDGWRVNVPVAEVAHPVVLTTTLARTFGLIFLIETREDDVAIEPPVDATMDVAAVALGFGVLLLDGSYIYAKSCGGPRVARATKLGPTELGVLTALFCKLGGHGTRGAQKQLEATQKEALAHATEWLDANPDLITLLQTDPERVAAGDYAVRDPQPWLVRVFSKKKRATDPLEAALAGGASDEDFDSLLASMPQAEQRRAQKPRDPKLDELRALVDEAMEEQNAE